ncbi:MAG: hypothetical protein ABI672_17870 [Vicinamibacteria bacterium]
MNVKKNASGRARFTTAGPGQIPVSPQPTPKIAVPAMIERSKGSCGPRRFQAAIR